MIITKSNLSSISVVPKYASVMVDDLFCGKEHFFKAKFSFYT